MSTRHRASGLGAALALVGAAFALARPGRPAEPPAAPRGGAGPASLAGTASCSARGCHGALGPAGDGPRLNEYTVWLARDPHARAYQALRGPRARQMAKNLAATNPGGREVPAEEDARCLACHANPLTAGLGPRERGPEGVGCEACHGAARGNKPWLEVHATARWRGLSADERATGYGMVPLEVPATQARTCAGCHVGAPADPDRGLPARDLNHDLIAAGHPRLQFELATYRANLPAHWRTDKYARSEPGYEARLWAVGQVVSARASLELLADRARKAEAPDRPWPEFAEYSCFACHAEVRGRDWRRPAHLGGRKPGSLPYSGWYSALLPVLAPRGDTLSDTFHDLGLALSRPAPDRKAVTDLAGKAARQLDALLGAVQKDPYDRAAVRRLLGGLAAHAGRAPALGWDETEQFALAVAALAQADRTLAATEGGPSPLGPEADARLRGLFRALAYPPGFEGPAGPRTAAGADGPLKELLKELPGGGGRRVPPVR